MDRALDVLEQRPKQRLIVDNPHCIPNKYIVTLKDDGPEWQRHPGKDASSIVKESVLAHNKARVLQLSDELTSKFKGRVVARYSSALKGFAVEMDEPSAGIRCDAELTDGNPNALRVGYRRGYRLHRISLRLIDSTIYDALRIRPGEPSIDVRRRPHTSIGVQRADRSFISTGAYFVHVRPPTATR